MVPKSFLSLGFYCLLMCSTFTVLSAQGTPSFSLSDHTVDAGDNISVDLTLTNFNNMLGTTFSLLWDSTKLALEGVSNIQPGMGSLDDNFNLDMAESGEMRYLYVSSMINTGMSLDDNTVLFRLNMRGIAEPTEEPQVANIEFGGLVEVVDTSEMALTVDFDEAVITIRGVVNTDELTTTPDFSVVATPNPFSGDAQLMINVEEQEEVTWQLSDVSGRRITQGKTILLPGTQPLTIAERYFKHTGTYLLSLQAGEKRLTSTLYFIENR